MDLGVVAKSILQAFGHIFKGIKVKIAWLFLLDT
jgi:hypothetical protein